MYLRKKTTLKSVTSTASIVLYVKEQLEIHFAVIIYWNSSSYNTNFLKIPFKNLSSSCDNEKDSQYHRVVQLST